MLRYKLVQKKNFTKGAAADSKLYYAMAQSAGRMEHEALVDAISTMSSASRGDIGLILDSLLLVMRQQLTTGFSVRLRGLGLFRITLGSTGTETEKEFTVANIKRPRIVFRPDPLLDKIRDGNKFENVTVKPETVTVTVTEPCDKEHVY
ncbi:HU family DNA-binding protein [Macellibacteroides fermentans]|uniref:HU family DNA-binding protein n=1 Tax=Macellibacteroides fermentans TaxID=879969 RepID=UPI003B9444D2